MKNIDKIKKQLGTRLKEVRNILGMSQTAIAKATESSLPSWQGYEAGKNVPGGKVLEALSRIGIDANWVLTGNGKMMLDSSNPRVFIFLSEHENEMLERLNEELTRVGVPQEGRAQFLAEKMGVQQKQFAFIDDGRFYSMRSVQRVCSFFGIDPEYIRLGYLPSSNRTPLREDVKLKVFDILEGMSEPNQWRAAALLLEFKEGLSSQAIPGVQQIPIPLDTPLIDMSFTVAVLDRFKNNGIKTLSDLLSLSDTDLLKLSRFGRAHLNNIKTVLHKNGLSLKGSSE